jgi:hypothetical protein
MTLFQRLEQYATMMDVSVLKLRQSIKEKRARLADLASEFIIPKDLGLGDTTTPATAMMNDVRRSLEREIALEEEAIVICQRASKFGKQHMFFRGPDELSPTNNKVPRLVDFDSNLAADCTAAGLTVWEEADADPNPVSRDGDILNVVS